MGTSAVAEAPSNSALSPPGEADFYPGFGTRMEWDTAAGQAIVEAAGGRVEPLPDPAHYGKPGPGNDAAAGDPELTSTAERQPLQGNQRFASPGSGSGRARS
jgi:hypothetical protein